MSSISRLFTSSTNQFWNRFTTFYDKVVLRPRIANFSGYNKGPGKGSGKGDDPLDPCCCDPCAPSGPPAGPTLYDIRKFGHKLPANDVLMYFQPLPHMPTGIFRPVDGETLGLGAGKNCIYKVPEYFAFHHMSFYDLHLLMRCFRLPCPKTRRKP